MADHIKRLVFYGMACLWLLGVVDSLANLPVLTGCGFYGQCASGGE